MRSLIHLTLFGFCLGLTACTQSKDVRDPLVTTVDPQLVEKQTQIETQLAKYGLEYDESHREFTGGESLFAACGEELIADLKRAQTDSETTQASLNPSDDNYREGALDFARKVKAVTESLQQINSNLQPYCESEHDKVVACLGSDDMIRVFINLNLADVGVIRPLIVPEKKSKAYVMTFNDSSGIRVRTTPKGDYPDENDSRLLYKNTSLERLQITSDCLNNQEFATSLGKEIKRTMKNAVDQSSRECAEMKAAVAAKTDRMSKDETRFCKQD